MKLEKIKSGAFARGLSLAKLSLAMGSKAASQSVASWFSSEDLPADERIRKLLAANAELIAREFGQLKGTVMKAGQMLSMYGERFLPPEANQFLKVLQSQSPPLKWSEIEKVLKKELGAEKLKLLEIEKEPLASASLGQVHRARLRSGGEWICLKVQYPGVQAAIKSDLAGLKRILGLAKLLPGNKEDYDSLFAEVQEMLEQEMDYHQEAQWTEFFREKLLGDSRYWIPKLYPEFSSKRVLASEYIHALHVDGPEVAAWPQQRRNEIAAAGIELYYRELLEWRAVQTDPHFGNYRIQSSEQNEGKGDRLVLFDFGAIRKIESPFFETYRSLIEGVLRHDAKLIQKAGLGLGLLREGDADRTIQGYCSLALLIGEPFAKDLQPYDWGESDLPQRVLKQGATFVMGQAIRKPPREMVFLDRKMGGIFIFMSTLKAKLDARPFLEKYLK